MDIRGHGESGGRFTFNRDEHHDAAIVAHELLRETRATRIDLIGLSMGGAVVVTTVSRHPELPWGKALLISPVAKFSRIRPFLNPLTAHRHLALGQALRSPRIDVRAWLGAKIDAEDEAPNVSIPVTIVHVKGDWLVDDSHGARLHHRCPQSVLHLLEIPGHWHADRIFNASPDAIEPAIATFMEE